MNTNAYVNLYAVYAANNRKTINITPRNNNDDNTTLWDEWLLNWGINPIASRYIYKIGIYGGTGHHVINDIRACRDFCRKMGVWFTNESEAYVFYDMGGENDSDDYRQYAEEVRLLREWCKKRGHNWHNYTYSADTECLVEHSHINSDAWFDAYYDETTYIV